MRIGHTDNIKRYNLRNLAIGDVFALPKHPTDTPYYVKLNIEKTDNVFNITKSYVCTIDPTTLVILFPEATLNLGEPVYVE